MKLARAAAAGVVLLVATSAGAASGDADAWLAWLILGAIALFVLGIAVGAVLAARFPRNYGAWARQRRERFAERNERWDSDDEAFRR